MPTKNKIPLLLICFISLIVLFPFTSKAQEKKVYGKIIHIQTKEPINNIRVKIKDNSKSTRTNEEGMFTLSVPDTLRTIVFEKFWGMTTLHTTQINDSTYYIELSDISPEDDIFSLTLEELMDITITTTTKTEQTQENTPASNVLITREEIARYGYTNLEEIFENIPGFYITNENSVEGKSINVRGFWSKETSHVFIMVNGITQIYEKSKSFQMKLIAVPVEVIERIEIVKGPMSTTYGSGAFFGAINIITNQKGNLTPENIIKTSISDKGDLQTVVSVRGQNKDLYFSVHTAYSQHQGEDMPYNKIMSNPSLWGYQNKSIGTQPYSGSSKYFNLHGSYKGFHTEITQTIGEQGFSLFFPPVPDEKTRQEYTVTHFIFGYNKQLLRKLSLKTDLIYQSSHIKHSNTIFLTSPVFGYYIDETEYYRGVVDLIYQHSDKTEIILGGHYHSIPTLYSTTNFPLIPNLTNENGRLKEGDAINTYAAYLNIHHQLSKSWFMYAGLRIEQQGEHLVPLHLLDFPVEAFFERRRQGEPKLLVDSFDDLFRLTDQVLVLDHDESIFRQIREAIQRVCVVEPKDLVRPLV